jgi:hypothetical protein
MANRREFLQVSTTALGLMTIPGAMLSAAINKPHSSPYSRVIFDSRFKEAKQFARQAEFSGIKTTSIHDDDITSLWYDDLRIQLNKTPGTIAGYTTENTAFLLEVLSHDVFHRQVSFEQHGELVQWVIAPIGKLQT